MSDRFVAYLLELARRTAATLRPAVQRVRAAVAQGQSCCGEVERCYRANQAVFGDQEWYFRGGELNNARFVPLAAYNELMRGSFAGSVRASRRIVAAVLREVARLGRLRDESRECGTRTSRERNSQRSARPIRRSVRCDALAFLTSIGCDGLCSQRTSWSNGDSEQPQNRKASGIVLLVRPRNHRYRSRERIGSFNSRVYAPTSNSTKSRRHSAPM